MKIIPFFLASFFILNLLACNKKPSGGLGGNANLSVSAFHHNLAIDSCTIYIKFNTSEAPADNSYDLNQVVSMDSNGSSAALFKGLKKGDYYIFARGWDPSISEDVKGGIPYTIREESHISIIVPVTETH